MDINWKEVELSDRELINSYYDKELIRDCEFTFANNFLWKPFYDTSFAIVKDSLVFVSEEAGLSVSFPQGASDLKAVIDELTVWFQEKNSPFLMHLVSPIQFGKLDELYPGRFQIEYDRDYADYVYEVEKLIRLSGKKYHGKKNHCNKFKQSYPDWSYEPITDENTEECRQMAYDWWRQNDQGEGGEKEEEIQVTLRALEYREKLGLKGGLIRAGGKVVAFTLGEPCGEDMYVIHFEKAFSNINGAYSMINQQFLEHEAEGYTFVNREDDAGSEGLRKAKLSYHPTFLMEKGLVTERE